MRTTAALVVLVTLASCSAPNTPYPPTNADAPSTDASADVAPDVELTRDARALPPYARCVTSAECLPGEECRRVLPDSAPGCRRPCADTGASCPQPADGTALTVCFSGWCVLTCEAPRGCPSALACSQIRGANLCQ